VALAQHFGVSRVVLARELSLSEVRAVRAATTCELEMFVHGALCVSYSGQCFSSEAWGGRSANRGQCAQACRLPYELIVDEAVMPLGDKRYLLSPGDLYALRQIPEIVDIGISALKIEGRYKDADYVALTTAAYRQAVDEAWAGLPQSVSPQDEIALEQVYSRGLGPWFVSGTNHQAVVDGRAPRHRGILVGTVARVMGDGVLITPSDSERVAPLKPGDGVVFDAAAWRSPELAEEGGRVYEVMQRVRGLEVRFGTGAINFGRIRPGDLLWRSDDPQLVKRVRPYTEANAPFYRRPLSISGRAAVGEPLWLVWALAERPEVRVEVTSPQPLVAAQNRGLTQESALAQLDRLGGTPYRLGDLAIEIDGAPFVPASLFNTLRRKAVDALAALQAEPLTAEVRDPAETLAATLAATLPPLLAERAEARIPTPQLHLLVRTPAQLECALALRPASITLDYLELYGLRPAVERVQASGVATRVASPRVLKPNEQRIVNFLPRLGCDLLIRSAGLLQALLTETPAAEGLQLDGDFSLNAANVLSATALLGLGLRRLTPTHDLNAVQIASLARAVGPATLEVIAYQHLPVFHMEHCVFCRFLSTGTSYKDCGHPCESHRVGLRDLHGRTHPVLADVGCRNTVFGAEAQEASAHLDAWRDAGIVHYRLEFVHEDAAQVEAVVAAFQATLQGERSAAALGRTLASAAPQGATEGSLFVPTGFTEIPLII
jgi:putative protease